MLQTCRTEEISAQKAKCEVAFAPHQGKNVAVDPRRELAVQPRWPSPSLERLKLTPALLVGRSFVSLDTTRCYTTLTAPSAFDTGSDLNSCRVYLSRAMANGLLLPTSYIKVTRREFFWASAQQRNRWIRDYCTAARRNVK